MVPSLSLTKRVQEVGDLFDASGNDFDVLSVGPVLLDLLLYALLLESCHCLPSIGHHFDINYVNPLKTLFFESNTCFKCVLFWFQLLSIGFNLKIWKPKVFVIDLDTKASHSGRHVSGKSKKKHKTPKTLGVSRFPSTNRSVSNDYSFRTSNANKISF